MKNLAMDGIDIGSAPVGTGSCIATLVMPTYERYSRVIAADVIHEVGVGKKGLHALPNRKWVRRRRHRLHETGLTVDTTEGAPFFTSMRNGFFGKEICVAVGATVAKASSRASDV